MSLKVLHTADWHLGKRLHETDLTNFQKLFLHELVGIIEEQSIDLVLLSGDVFDQANPSNEARTLYYNFLAEIAKLSIKLIITGGNHDSPSNLNAPKELLKAFDVQIIGSYPENQSDLLIPVEGEDRTIQLVVAAVPFLRDADLRSFSSDISTEDRLEQVRDGIRSIYSQVAIECEKKYPGIPAIAMGHLFIAGSEISESEREIQVGNAAGVGAKDFPEQFNYIALGHIHKPGKGFDKGRIRYSGSPYPLSFSERGQEKRLVLLNLEGNNFKQEDIMLTASYELSLLKGTLSEIELQLKDIEKSEGESNLFLELELNEEKYDLMKVRQFQDLIKNWSGGNTKILKYRMVFAERLKGLSELYEEESNIEDLSPKEVFQKKMEQSEISAEDRMMLEEAFNEILQELIQEGGEG